MTAGVYAIVNTVDGMAYVGSSVDIEIRWVNHRSTLRRGEGPSRAMVEAWQEHDGQGFEFLVLEEVLADDEALEEAERRWFDHYAGRLYNSRKIARRARADIVTLRRRMKWSGGKLSGYQQRQLTYIERIRRPAPDGAGGGEGA